MNTIVEHLLPQLAAFAGAIFTGVAGYVFGRGKLRAETEGLEAENEGKELENADKLVRLYKDAIDDLGSRYEKKYQEVTALYENKVRLLEDELKMHKRIINQLKSEIAALRKRLKENGIVP